MSQAGVSFSLPEYILGLDLGVASVGWSAIELIDGAPAGILGGGARVFEAAAPPEQIEKGREELRNAQRREARLRRRQARRRARRLAKVYGILAEAKMLPTARDEAERQKTLDRLDGEILARHPGHAANLPYWLRARALDEKLEPSELGRALYHLAQRRGFLSNRKAPIEDEKEQGKVRGDISALRAKIAEAGARTLGEYFAGIDPQEERIRQRYTERGMYAEEFDRIWEGQAPHYPEILTEEMRSRLRRAIFFQRPLKTAEAGECEFEEGRKRAPWAVLAAQRFRLLQKANDLSVGIDDWHDRDLTAPERAVVVQLLESEADVTFPRLRKELGLKGKFNLERGGEKRLVGNRTVAKLREILGERWEAMPAEERDRLVEDWLSFVSDEALKRRAIRHWRMTEEQATAFAKVQLQSGHCGLSRQALKKLLPPMEEGKGYSEAVKEVYESRFSGGEAHELLPPVRECPRLRALRNPMVERTLTEMRKVVNGVIRQYGKPVRIVVELGRDLKRSRGEREKLSKRMRERESDREKAREAVKKAGVADPKRADIEKWLLAEECAWECPYTGRKISVRTLFGDAPEFDVEHIIPRGRSLDDSFANKTLCEAAENRHSKAGKTPREAYEHDAARYEEILRRLRGFHGDEALRRAKLRRFEMTTDEVDALLKDFTEEQLNDTRYASKTAADYLGMLYGGRDQNGTRRIYATSGQVTAMLRSAWDLNPILGRPDGRKERGDLRHHAIDAVAIALTEPRRVAELARAAEMSAIERKRKFSSLPGPFPDFVDKVRRLVDGIVVSHRMEHVLRGPLHEETNYGKEDDQGRRRLRRPWDKAKPGEIGDRAVREAVERATKEKPPFLVGRDGQQTPIKKVRIWVKERFASVGEGARLRHVSPGNNHHVEVIEERGKWKFEVVTRLEAMRRKKAGQPVVNRQREGFLFSLMGGDTMQMQHESGVRHWVLQSMSQEQNGRLVLIPAHLGLEKAKKEGLIERPMAGSFRKMAPEKAQVDPLGRVFPAHD
ncbi:MAG TPA: type II CRISPR RNA-guided endonuclease Cas9 [Bryobacterales bacterium]|nr:type II CRISPR RNA-guided endonuclease Cas9 [Bryobacterales bacterium]